MLAAVVVVMLAVCNRVGGSFGRQQPQHPNLSTAQHHTPHITRSRHTSHIHITHSRHTSTSFIAIAIAITITTRPSRLTTRPSSAPSKGPRRAGSATRWRGCSTSSARKASNSQSERFSQRERAPGLPAAPSLRRPAAAAFLHAPPLCWRRMGGAALCLLLWSVRIGAL